DAAGQGGGRHGHVGGGGLELREGVGALGHDGVDGGDQRVDVHPEVGGHGVGRQLAVAGAVDEGPELGPVAVELGLGLVGLGLVAGGLAQRVVHEEADVV